MKRRLDLHKQLRDAKLPQTRTLLQRQIDATDRQIDLSACSAQAGRLVYDLYELTEEEIAIVEKS